MIERNWDRDFELAAWQAQDRGWRHDWLCAAMELERDEDDAYAIRRQRYERGQTAWDVGLDPLPFDITLWVAVGEVKPEHWDGVILGSRDVRHRVLSALLANAGLRRTVRLAPRRMWEQTLANSRASGTHTIYETAPAPDPVTQHCFATSPEGAQESFRRVTRDVAQPFHRWQSDRLKHTPGERGGVRVFEMGYLVIDAQTIPCVDLLVLRESLRSDQRPTASDAALVVHVATDQGSLLFDLQVRRASYLEAGALEVWIVDPVRQRVLRHCQGAQPVNVVYFDPAKTLTWCDASGDAVVVKLIDVFGNPKNTTSACDSVGEFDAFNAAELARLLRRDTGWAITHAPQWFSIAIGDILGGFKDELWRGILFGPEYRRDEILSMLLANVGLKDALQLAPQELWEQAVALRPSVGTRNGTLDHYFFQ